MLSMLMVPLPPYQNVEQQPGRWRRGGRHGQRAGCRRDVARGVDRATDRARRG
jgi:hypothetical protein